LLFDHHADNIVELPVRGATDERGSDGGGNPGERGVYSELRVYNRIDAADDTEQCDIDHIYSKYNGKWRQCPDPDSTDGEPGGSPIPGKYIPCNHNPPACNSAVNY